MRNGPTTKSETTAPWNGYVKSVDHSTWPRRGSMRWMRLPVVAYSASSAVQMTGDSGPPRPGTCGLFRGRGGDRTNAGARGRPDKRGGEGGREGARERGSEQAHQPVLTWRDFA